MNDLLKTALVIEDDVGLFRLLENILTMNGVTSVQAGTVSRAKSFSANVQPSLIFVDNHLPDGYGFNCITLLRKKFPGAVIVAMTSDATAKIKTKAKCDGADWFLQKPFELKDIFDLIQHRFN